MFEIDPRDKYYVEMATKKRSNGFYCFLKAELYYDSDGTLYEKYIVVLQNKKDSDFVPFSTLAEATKYFNSIV